MTGRAVHVAGTGFVVLDRVYADDRESFEALGGSCGNVLVSLAMLDRAVAPLRPEPRRRWCCPPPVPVSAAAKRS